ncbi:ABC transporter ATP-binding protein [Microlunatus sp. Gsoil 973]|jgi:peptide/nickel transport system ATP-binding protein|uniref:ABC transporter ATP-binding protein n=1 Tax=Microlunatus sp. Gsoil 973 TaxID=2672569 RepID=UPI0012B4F8F2|nr:ABC transporter ATP-binding protein [Microlunatus sp. Gsoil 973]QGN35095.1 ATP-binding cassette domain-containing protein [Microlunatus sp. Gsoil 973]
MTEYTSRSRATGLRLLDAHNLRAAYYTPDGNRVVAVDDVSISINEGEVLGIAGESGCGKSTLGAILSLTAREPLVVEHGTLEVDGKQQHLGPRSKLPRTWRGSVVSMLPQGAMNSISPTMRVRDLVFDVMRAHDRGVKRSEALDRARDRFDELGLPVRALDAYPHQLSGGMKQRVVTVISTLLNPRLLIADEPTSALDVSSQKALIEMLLQMLENKIMSGVVFITHDLPVLRTVSNRIAVMYAGKIAEIGDAEQISTEPRHPYSAALLNSVLVPEPSFRRKRVKGIPGSPPNLLRPPSGCRFHPRCGLAMDVCKTDDPPEVGDELRFSTCWWAQQNPGVPVPVDRVVPVEEATNVAADDDLAMVEEGAR